MCIKMEKNQCKNIKNEWKTSMNTHQNLENKNGGSRGVEKNRVQLLAW